MTPQRDWYTTAEAAAELGLSPASLRDALRRGAIHAIALTPHLRAYTREEIERYRREHLGRSGWATRRAMTARRHGVGSRRGEIAGPSDHVA